VTIFLVLFKELKPYAMCTCIVIIKHGQVIYPCVKVIIAATFKKTYYVYFTLTLNKCDSMEM